MPIGQYIRKPRDPYKSIHRPVIIPIGPSIAYVPLTQELFSLIDRDDAECITQFTWYAMKSSKSDSFYAARSTRDPLSKRVLIHPLHDLIMGIREGFTVDHRIAANTLDNRKCNLRHATPQQQACNKRKQKSNTSGYKGVRLRKGRWDARITHDGKQFYIGGFDTKELAYEAYCKKAKQLHGEFASVA